MTATVILTKKSIIWTWCKKCMVRTEHVYDPSKKIPLACLKCHPEKDPRSPGVLDSVREKEG